VGLRRWRRTRDLESAPQFLHVLSQACAAMLGLLQGLLRALFQLAFSL
jgi:hypothetical protein